MRNRIVEGMAVLGTAMLLAVLGALAFFPPSFIANAQPPAAAVPPAWPDCAGQYDRAGDVAAMLATLEPESGDALRMRRVGDALHQGAIAARIDKDARQSDKEAHDVLCSTVHLQELAALTARYQARVELLQANQGRLMASAALTVVERELDRTQ